MIDLPPEEQVVPATITCPGCGVLVAVGYPKCPRCHAPVPQSSRSKRVTFREEMIAGGTSLEPPVDATRLWPWLLALALVVGSVVAWLATRSGDSREAAPTDSEVLTEDEDDDSELAEDGEDDGDMAARRGAPEPADPTAVDLGPAIRALDGALRSARLWSKVTVDDDVVVIESAQCGDDGIGSVIGDHAADLKAAGARTLRCREPHGAVVFERGL